MFSSIGWTEIAVIILLAIVVIGPERLPGVIADVRAAIYAARKAINNAKAELNG
ncbi:MAG: twin-arginine translocase TatA/TatE family subunit, partial [Corynebacterium flavescens]